MKLQIQSIHFDADKKLLQFIQKKMDKLETFFDRILDGEVYLRVENTDIKNKSVHIKVNIPNTSLNAKETGDSFEEAVDLAVETMARQLKKTKDKQSSY